MRQMDRLESWFEIGAFLGWSMTRAYNYGRRWDSDPELRLPVYRLGKTGKAQRVYARAQDLLEWHERVRRLSVKK